MHTARRRARVHADRALAAERLGRLSFSFFAGFLVSSIVDLGAHGVRILRAAHRKECAVCLDEEGAPCKEETEKVRASFVVVLVCLSSHGTEADPSGELGTAVPEHS